MRLEVKEYPFDTAHLQKGDRVPREVVERAFNVVAGTDAYRLAMLRARAFLLLAFANRGEVVTVVEERSDLVILNDEEAALYNERTYELALNAARRSHARKLAVDRAKLQPTTLERHDRVLVVQGRQLHAIAASTPALPSPRKRSTPGRLAE
jgi:hypothetical protein